MKSRFMSTPAVQNIVKRLAELGYDTTNDEGELTCMDDDIIVFKALPHSNGKSYVFSYNPDYMQSAK